MPCPASLSGLLPCCTVFCFVVFGCYILETCSFLKGNERGVGVKERGGGVRELGGVEGEETGWDVLYETRLNFQ